jgi:DNA-binding NarL/FixJ family response regulator
MATPKAKSKIRILLVDDHILMRIGLASDANHEPDMEVVAEAEDGAEALAAYRAARPDVVVLDLRMPRQNGIETIGEIRRAFADARILVLSNYSGGDDIGSAMQAGATGYAVKEMALDQILDAIRKVHAGEQFLPPEIARRLAGRLLSNLSARELEVLKLITRGLSNKEIAGELKLVEGTVKLHVSSILSKLGVVDRTQAIITAIKRGIVQIE